MLSRSSKSSFRKFAKWSTSVLLAVIQFVQKSSLHRVFYKENVKESVLILVTYRYSLLSFITRHPEHDKIKIDMAESEETFEGVFEFSVQETSKDLSQNGGNIVLTPEQEAD